MVLNGGLQGGSVGVVTVGFNPRLSMSGRDATKHDGTVGRDLIGRHATKEVAVSFPSS